MTKIFTCPRCNTDITQKDIQNFEEKETEIKLREEFKLSEEYRERKFDKREKRMFWLDIFVCMLSCFVLAGVGLWLVSSYPLRGISVIFLAAALYVYAVCSFLKGLTTIDNEENEFFEAFKQKRMEHSAAR